MRYSRRVRTLCLGGLGLATALAASSTTSAWAASPEGSPVAVSPGDATKVALIRDDCPTFSWGEVEGAKSYDLVVYRLGEQDEHEEPVLQRSFPGSVDGWTPALDQCLERGGRYAWSVRAVGGREASEWSELSLFQVASGPSEAEFEEAVTVVEQYLNEREVVARQAASAGSLEPPSKESSSRGEASLLGTSVSGLSPLSPLSPPLGDSDLQVNGSPVVTVANLAGVQCRFTGLRYFDQGDGTVLDCNTGLIWLKDASCADLVAFGTDSLGRGGWDTAQSAAASLADGICGLTDGSVAGYWRQPNISEFCRAWFGLVLFPCPAPPEINLNLVDSTLGSAPYVRNTAGTGLWSEGDAFVGVRSGFYWSATELDAINAWLVNLINGRGNVNHGSRDATLYVWPVRSGQ